MRDAAAAQFVGRCLITGSEGVIGRALRAALAARGCDVVGLDLRGKDREKGDVRDAGRVSAAFDGIEGVVHLAAVSRVVRAERAPDVCRNTNVGGLRNVLEAAGERTRTRPWVLFASSREVYGQPRRLPVSEDAPLCPLNVYGRSKVEGERLAEEAKSRGHRVGIVRFSNVYGGVGDHADRVVPAFARAAVAGSSLRLDGPECVFDFTHIDDTVRGVVALVDLLANGRSPPPVHLLTGVPTALHELATMAIELAGEMASVVEAPPRSFDVSRFHGDPARARELIGWTPRVDLRNGLGRLIERFRAEAGRSPDEEAVP